MSPQADELEVSAMLAAINREAANVQVPDRLMCIVNELRAENNARIQQEDSNAP